MPSMDTVSRRLPESSHKMSMQTLRSDADVEIFKSFLLSRTVSNPALDLSSVSNYYTISRSHSRRSSVMDTTIDPSQFSDSTTPDNSPIRRMSLPGGSDKLRQLVYSRIDQRKQFSCFDFETHKENHTKRHTKSIFQKIFNKSTFKDSDATGIKEYGVLEVLSSKIASCYFLAFLLERKLESTALFIWDCLKSEKEAPVTVLVHDYCLKDSPLLLPSLPNVDYEKLASAAMNRNDLIISVSKAISPILIASFELFTSTTLFLSFESVGQDGFYTKKDQDLAVKTLSRYVVAYAQDKRNLNLKIDERLHTSLGVDVTQFHKSADMSMANPFRNYAVYI